MDALKKLNSHRGYCKDVRQSLAALKNLKAEVDKWDPLLMGVLTRKLDPYTARAFQMERDQEEEPTVVELLEYLDRKALSMENSGCNDKSAAVDQQEKRGQPAIKPAGKVALAAAMKTAECNYCKSTSHKLFACPQFKLLPASKRISFASEKKLCSTCLNTHNGRCKFHFKCSQCQDKGHHTLLHPDEASNPVVLQSVANNDVLLPTARVKVYAKDGREVHIKCVLDSCSQSSLITSKAVDVLGFTPKPSNTKLIGVTESLSQVKYCIPLEIHSLTSSYKRLVSFEVVDSITCNLPQNPIDLTDFKFPDGIKLSDETFNKPSEINMLMSAGIFFQVLQLQSQPEVLRCDGDPACNDLRSLSIIDTKLGHVVAGDLPHESGDQQVALFCRSCDSEVSHNVKKFWEVESVPQLLKEGDSEQQIAEDIFTSTVKLVDKRFQVDLPLKVEPSCSRLKGSCVSCWIEEVFGCISGRRTHLRFWLMCLSQINISLRLICKKAGTSLQRMQRGSS
ncbi:putative peptidase (DUF1758) domain-containing protein [Phthorimaea operculella]|nr:putative peptidase (DUF1758) domain-containing protein [Phthorimaea operculella]